jgi:hypothetical protein
MIKVAVAAAATTTDMLNRQLMNFHVSASTAASESL